MFHSLMNIRQAYICVDISIEVAILDSVLFYVNQISIIIITINIM